MFQRSVEDVNLLFEVSLVPVGLEELKWLMIWWFFTGNLFKYVDNVHRSCSNPTFMVHITLLKALG